MKLRSVVSSIVTLWALPAVAQSGYPVVTHYPAAGGTQADTTRRAVPAYENYSASVTDETMPSQQEFNTARQLVFQAAGAQATFLNDPAGLVEGAATIQIVNNWPIGAALYTVAFPVNWRRTGSYPIVLSGNPTTYSNNYRVFRGQEAGVLGFGAGRGFIAAFSNAGGIESQGVSDNVLRSVGQALDTFATLGGDKHRVITGGFSRGASTAMVWAANPLDLDYTVIAVFGHALPTNMLEAVTAPYATYPWLGWFSDLVTNDPSQSRYDHVPPPHTLPNNLLQILTGQGTAEARTPSVVIERLRGKQLAFSVATHDSIVPYKTGVAFTRALEAAGIPHMAVLVQNTGHVWSLEIFDELVRAMTEIGAGRPYAVPAGRVYATQSELRTHDYNAQTRVVRATMPFSAVLPYRAARGQPMRVDLCGAPGAQYVVCGVLDGTAARSTVYLTGEIPPEECTSEVLAAPLQAGDYTWNVVVNGNAIPRTQTPVLSLRPALQVLAAQPGHFDAMPGQLPVMMGISELSPQLGEAPVACPPPESTPGIDAGPLPDSGFQINVDTGVVVDSGIPRDAGFFDLGVADTGNRAPPEEGCGCAVVEAPGKTGPGSGSDAALIVLLLGLAALRRRAR